MSINSSDSNKRIAKNTLMLYLRMFLTMVVGLYTSRVVLQTLGVEDYGIYGVVGGIVSMMGFLNASMSGATSRFLTFELGRGNKERLGKTFSSALIVHIIIAAIVFVVAETIGLWFLCNKLVIPEGRMVAAHWVYQLSILSSMLTITQVPYNSSIIAHEKMDIYAYVEILNVTLKLLIVYLLLIGNFDKLILYSILTLAVSVIIMMVYRIYCLRKFAECRFHWIWDKEYLKPLISFSGWDLYGNMAFSVRQQGANFLLNMFFGVVLNAACNIASTIQGILLQFSSNIILVFKPVIIKQYAKENMSDVNRLLRFATKMSTCLLAIISVAVYVKADYVLKIWLGYVPDAAVILTRISLIINFFSCLGSVLIIGIHATGKVLKVGLINGTLYMLSIPVMYIMLKCGCDYQSCYIMFMITTFIFCLSNLLILHHDLKGFEVRNYILQAVMPSAIAVGISFIFMCWISKFFPNTIYSLFVFVLISSFVTMVICFMVMLHQDERLVVLSYLKNKILR